MERQEVTFRNHVQSDLVRYLGRWGMAEKRQAEGYVRGLRISGWAELEPGVWFYPPNPQPFTLEEAVAQEFGKDWATSTIR